jgi:DNA topoisomerase-1
LNLIYTNEQMPGIRRARRGKGFAFYLPDGSLLSDPIERRRIAALAIPPAYENVWICLHENGHLQATGIDSRGRKQYRYHPAWHERANQRKFSGLPEFVAALPRIRARARLALQGDGITRERVIAGVVALLDETGYRIGNRRYEQFNRSFGLASLLMKHLREDEEGWTLKFRGKSGQIHETQITDPKLVTLFAELQELPGQHLFRYQGEDGVYHDIGTADVNAWLKEIGGGDFTAKQFRTWKATVLCATLLGHAPTPEEETGIKRAIKEAVKGAAEMLHHTPTTCRKYYLPPRLFSAFRKGTLFGAMQASSNEKIPRGLRAQEARVLAVVAPPSKSRRVLNAA